MTKTKRTRRHGTLATRCSRCSERVEFQDYPALGRFMNEGRVCEKCKGRALAEDTFSRIEGSIAAQEAFARRIG